MSNRIGKWVIYADGGLQAEKAGAGIVMLDWRGAVVWVENQTLSPMTNNEAEYMALLLALQTAAKFGASPLEIRMDSEVVVNQMSGRFSVNSPKLKLLHLRACEVARGLPSVRYVYIPRELNEVADALATEAAAGRVWRSVE